MKNIIIALILAPLSSGVLAQTATLSNRVATLEVNLQGGGITRYALNELKLNPFSWRSKWNHGCEGFFLCFDRIGPSSPEDKAKGIPPHGEAHAQPWKILKQTPTTLRLQCDLPIANMTVIREYYLYPKTAICRITDRFKNNNTFEKPYNILLHPSIGSPFLDRNLLIDSNATEGFIREKNATNPSEKTITWSTTDVRHMSGVANFRTSPGTTQGWVSIANPQKGLLIGYLWETADYPWIRLWREWENENPTALGVEFGTSPLGIPLEQIKQVGNILDLPTLCTLPPGGETQHTFHLLLSKIPTNYHGTENITITPNRLILKESKTNRTTTIEYNTAP